MSTMSQLYQTVTEYLDQGDNIYRIASVLNVPLAWVEEIQAELKLLDQESQPF